ncbi:hypothetical protein BaRGS_00029803 [Batillaria attramentaria]|uniref:Ferritin n=1 Tax=Batillaria attramentaria TaxID=370345 RepID=A0ABD0JW34_9CAEN
MAYISSTLVNTDLVQICQPQKKLVKCTYGLHWAGKVVLKMEKGIVFFCGIIAIVVALLIPISVLQKSDSVVVIHKKRHKHAKKSCEPFTTPWAPIGEYRCEQAKEGKWYCVLWCPSSMTKEPRRNIKIAFRCKNGQWKHYPKDKSRCAARRSVAMVEQNSSPPKLINELLHNYLNNSYNYLAMAYFCDRADVQLPGFHKFFMTLWQDGVNMARDIMSYINKRGGWIELQELPKPAMRERMHQGLEEDHVGLVAMETALAMERDSSGLVSEIIERVERIQRSPDPHLVHTLEDNHLAYKVKVIKQIADYVTKLRSFQTTGEDYSLGEYEVDNNLQ